MSQPVARPIVAIACGGTGGHLFPGIAVGRALRARGADVTLLISRKEIDQLATRGAGDFPTVALPAVGWNGRNPLAFLLGFGRAWRAVRAAFRRQRPHAVLAMGGFTSAPPVLAGRARGAATFLHEANTIPGRANRWLARRVDEAFVFFPAAAARLGRPAARVVGMPVREEFVPRDPAGARAALGLDPARPVLLVMGGSQGARGINDLMLRSVARLSAAVPRLQFLHLAGMADQARLRDAYRAAGVSAAVYGFLAEMDLALAAATVAVSRAGAGALAELAALRLPAVLIPYPAAADDHQRHNARAFVESGAARCLEQAGATPEQLAAAVSELAGNAAVRAAVQAALARWHSPAAAGIMADCILDRVGLVPAAGAGARAASGTEFIRRPAAPPPRRPGADGATLPLTVNA
jgi:UDP-N-acetylglucosamine--N-acetylmuramyl-(pentapeptide) pyrophosphoryl-undecaprenol N-acetylglucosamine transferase